MSSSALIVTSSLLISATLLISSLLSAAPISADAKPINQNQVKFRRLPPKEFSAALGASITIECEAGSSPPPTIHWLKNGKRIQQDDFDENHLDDGGLTAGAQVDEVSRIALSSTRSRLFIDCASAMDEAVYTCVAENVFNRISSHTKLNLLKPAPEVGGELAGQPQAGQEEVVALEFADKASAPLSAVPQCLSQRSSVQRASEPLRIHMWTHNLVEVQKNDVLLFCRSNANKSSFKQQQQPTTETASQAGEQLTPAALTAALADLTSGGQAADSNKKAYVSWTLPNDKLVAPDQKDKFEILATGDLWIKNLHWSDLGSYVCTVSDDNSSDSVSTFVYPAAVKAKQTKRALMMNSLKF